MIGISFSATDLRDFAQANGWVLVPDALRDGLFVLDRSDLPEWQLVFSKDEEAPDYERSLHLGLETLSNALAVPVERLAPQVARVNSDALRFRIFGPHVGTSLPLAFMADAVNGAKQLLLACAHSVLSPRLHHPRLGRSQALDFLSLARFGQTDVGSFVFTVTCPMSSPISTPSLFADEELPPETPFARKVTFLARQATEDLVSAVESGTEERLWARDQTNPHISSNFCSALLYMHDEALRNALELDFSWASAAPLRWDKGRLRPLRIQPDYFPHIAEIAWELQAAEASRSDVFVGTVERLDGEIGNDGRRFGEVTMLLFSSEEEPPVRARTFLPPDLYAAASEAHMSAGAWIRVEGTLHPGRQPRRLEIRIGSDVQVYSPDQPTTVVAH